MFSPLYGHNNPGRVIQAIRILVGLTLDYVASMEICALFRIENGLS